jgi:tricorn protease
MRLYDPDGKWFAEGHGVDPDIEVVENPSALARGSDAQLERGIQEAQRLLKEPGRFQAPPTPQPEIR